MSSFSVKTHVLCLNHYKKCIWECGETVLVHQTNYSFTILFIFGCWCAAGFLSKEKFTCAQKQVEKQCCKQLDPCTTSFPHLSWHLDQNCTAGKLQYWSPGFVPVVMLGWERGWKLVGESSQQQDWEWGTGLFRTNAPVHNVEANFDLLPFCIRYVLENDTVYLFIFC